MLRSFRQYVILILGCLFYGLLFMLCKNNMNEDIESDIY